MLQLKRTFLVMAVFGLIYLAKSQDDELYDPAPPTNAAFVRVVHAATSTPAFTPIIGDTNFGNLEYGDATPYHLVIQGERTIHAGEDLKQSFSVTAGKFFTVAIVDSEDGPQLLVLEDSINTNRARALLSLYNFTELAAVDLKTADASINVITEVASGEVKSVTVNPIAVDLALVVSDEVIETLAGLQLARGAAYSVFVMGPVQNLQAVWILSTTNTQ